MSGSLIMKPESARSFPGGWGAGLNWICTKLDDILREDSGKVRYVVSRVAVSSINDQEALSAPRSNAADNAVW